MRGIEPAQIVGKPPKFEWVDPKTLYVEEQYQREVGPNGVALIRKIYSGFSWARMKPPVCVRLQDFGSVLVCIDGQHTATAAASHPDIAKIPIMVVDAAQAALRAAAFVGHNRDRISLTAQAIYHAELAAGEEVAGVIDRACRSAGASIPRQPISTKEKLPVGTTVALGTLKQIARRQGEATLTRVLRLAVAARRAPIRADEAAALVVVANFAAEEVDDKIVGVMTSKSAEEWCAEARVAGVASGETTAAELGKMWLRALSVPAEVPVRRGVSLKSGGGTERIIRSIAPGKPRTEVKNIATPLPEPRSQADQNRYVRRNGVVVDLFDSELACRGVKVRLDNEEMPVVAALARVMPALLDYSHLERKAFGKITADGPIRLRAVADKVNPGLARVGLQIKVVPKMGMTLSEVS